MDTSTSDTVLTQLKKLREGVGLNAARLEQVGAVMSSLGTSDPLQAHEQLLSLLHGLPDSDRVRALRVDFNLGLDDLLLREPSTREAEWLGERRSGYSAVVERDVKTLGRWSDRAISELRALLLNDTFTGDLFVVASVRGDRTLGMSFIQQPLDATKDGITKRETMEIANPSDEASMPCLVYAFPRDWRPATLTLAVAFHGEQRPARVWATYSDNMLKLPFGEERWELTLSEDGVASCTFKRPRRELVFGVWWKHPEA